MRKFTSGKKDEYFAKEILIEIWFDLGCAHSHPRWICSLWGNGLHQWYLMETQNHVKIKWLLCMNLYTYQLLLSAVQNSRGPITLGISIKELWKGAQFWNYLVGQFQLLAISVRKLICPWHLICKKRRNCQGDGIHTRRWVQCPRGFQLIQR